MMDTQVNDYPKGARIEAIREVSCHVGSIPIGTKGTVSDHTHDGRAWIYFDGYNAGHTFHEPELFIRVVQQASEESPAPRAGEGERFGFVVFTGRYKVLDYFKPDGQQIATADGEEEARIIVRALNAAEQHSTLLAQRDRLLNALRDVNHAWETGVDAQSRWARKIRAAIRLTEQEIATVEQEGKS